MKLTVKNFGPIKDAEVEINQLLLLIGPQASGKSVLAKLIAIFSDIEFLSDRNLNKFLSIYNIEFLTNESYLRWDYEDSYIEYENSIMNTNLSGDENLKLEETLENLIKEYMDEELLYSEILQKNPEYKEFPKSTLISAIKKAINEKKELHKKQLEVHVKSGYIIYIPTERTLVSTISDFLYNFIKSNIKLPECIINFGAKFEEARKEINDFKVPFLENIQYIFEKNSNQLKIGESKKINFSQSSSGLQAVIPMSIVLESIKENEDISIVIEEPELNLYPSTQKKLVQYLSENCLNKKKNLTITTHSPYILTAFANLIQADNTAKVKPELVDDIKKIIPKKTWVDFENVKAYYINDGTAKDILDYENRTIDANAIDDVSETIAQEFEALLNIKYRD